ncbi:MAG: VOC family protein [Pseudomonadota bacterium]
MSFAFKDIEFVGPDFEQLQKLFKDRLSFSSVIESENETVLQNGGAIVRLVSPSKNEVHVARHGTSIKQVSFYVADVADTVRRAKAAGAKVLFEGPQTAAIEIYPGLIHQIWINNNDVKAKSSSSYGFEVIAIDHLAICLPEHDFGLITDRYRQIFELSTSHEEYVVTGVSAMNSVVLTDENEATKLVFMQPQEGPEKSQIQKFIDEFGGAGVQHIAFEVKDIVHNASWMTGKGLEMLRVPDTYYDVLDEEIDELPYPLDALKNANVLVDEDGTGQLLQAFTKPVFERKTVFIELVERRGSTGFGSGNIKSLFKAVEREMAQHAQ